MFSIHFVGWFWKLMFVILVDEIPTGGYGLFFSYLVLFRLQIKHHNILTLHWNDMERNYILYLSYYVWHALHKNDYFYFRILDFWRWCEIRIFWCVITNWQMKRVSQLILTIFWIKDVLINNKCRSEFQITTFALYNP